MERSTDNGIFADANYQEILGRRADDSVVASMVDDMAAQGVATRVFDYGDGTVSVFRAVVTESQTDTENSDNGEGQNGERENQKGVSADEIGRSESDQTENAAPPVNPE